jgi:urease subunit alpha
MNRFSGSSNASLPDALAEQVNAGVIGLKLHEDQHHPSGDQHRLDVADATDGIAIHWTH